MGNKCENCTEKCPQAEMAHQAALGRMYATKEFTTLLKKVENGELVEVVRCKDCKDHNRCEVEDLLVYFDPTVEHYCCHGERRSENDSVLGSS